MTSKVYPIELKPCCSSEERVKYTVWMKSLVLHSNGCTIYDSNGKLVYRIDNYNTKCSSKVYLMDHNGKVLCSLLRKKLNVHELWIGYKGEGVKNERPWFKVKKITIFFNMGLGFSCQVRMGGDKSQACSCFIRIQGSAEKSEFQIISGDGHVAAQIKRKQSSKGVMLGDDVLSLEVEPHLDHSLIMALVVVHGLMCHKI